MIWLDAEDETTGLALLRRPEQRASLVLTGRRAQSRWSATALYVGDRDDVDPASFARTVNPAYVRLDLAAEYAGFARLRPYARLENALDESYEEVLGFPAAPRSLIGGLALTWR